jgi:phage terminase small subunit
MRKQPQLRPEEILFCANYVNSGNIRESALKAGYKKNSEHIGLHLLSRKDISEEIDRQYQQKKKNLIYRACSGYERLAFGSITDAIKLLYASNPTEASLENLDLFNIAEIKKPREGTIEIKFFDRLKALEKLQELNLSTNSQENTFYEALERSASSLT